MAAITTGGPFWGLEDELDRLRYAIDHFCEADAEWSDRRHWAEIQQSIQRLDVLIDAVPLGGLDDFTREVVILARLFHDAIAPTFANPGAFERQRQPERKPGLKSWFELESSLLRNLLRQAVDQEIEPASVQHSSTVPEPPPPPVYVDLKQMAAIVNKTKAALEKRRDDLPTPDVRPGQGTGKANEWLWEKVRPVLEKIFNRPLPEVFPGDRFQRN